MSIRRLLDFHRNRSSHVWWIQAIHEKEVCHEWSYHDEVFLMSWSQTGYEWNLYLSMKIC